MCEQTEINYLDGDIVWVKLGACWWPGQVTGFHNLPEDIQDEFQKKPLIAAVKFFQEDTYEFVKNYQQIYKYNCTLKDEFIRKGLDKYRSKSKDGSRYMDKFPGDVEMAEKLTGGDPDILSHDKFCPEEKPDISALFGDKKIPKKKRERDETHRRSDSFEIVKKITHPRFLKESDHEVRIRQQPSSLPSTPSSTGSPVYPCHLCSFTSSRVNVIICHIKSHRSGNSPIARSKVKSFTQGRSKYSVTDTPKRKYVKKEKSQSSKSKNENKSEPAKRKPPKQVEKVAKKKKTDPKIRDTILADWEDESDDDLSLMQTKPLDISSIISSPTKGQCDSFENEESSQKNNTVTDGNEIIEETEKLLRETEKLTSIDMIDDTLTSNITNNLKSMTPERKESESEADTKGTDSATDDSINKSEKERENSNSDSESKHAASDKDDKKSLLSCFDFHEEEPSIPPVRKKARAFHQKKEIIKEFELSQAMKSEQEKENESDKLMESDFQRDSPKKEETEEDVEMQTNTEDAKKVEEKDIVSTAAEETVTETKPTPVKEAEEKDESEEMTSSIVKKSGSNTSPTEVEIVEIFELEKEETEQESTAHNAKNKEKETVDKTATTQSHPVDTVVPENDVSQPISEEKQLESKDLIPENKTIESLESTEQISSKETEETSSERFTTETEDETVSESAETLPEQSENSDAEMIDADQVPDKDPMDILLNSQELNVTPKAVKRRRGRPRKNTDASRTDTSGTESPKVREPKSSKKFAEKMEIERRTSESDTERSYSGRKRKPNKKYLESDIYDTDQRASRTDDSQSESDDKSFEKIKSKSRRSKRSLGTDKRKTESVEDIEEKELELSQHSLGATDSESNVLKLDFKDNSSESNANKDKITVEAIEKPFDTQPELSISEKLQETTEAGFTTKESDAQSLTEEVKISMSENDEKIDKAISDMTKIDSGIETDKLLESDKTDQNDSKNTSAISTNTFQLDTCPEKEESQQQPETLKSTADMLPPKKQIKKFELSQIDFFDDDASTNKIGIDPEPEPDGGTEIQEKMETETTENLKEEKVTETPTEEEHVPVKTTTDTGPKVEETVTEPVPEAAEQKPQENIEALTIKGLEPVEMKTPEKQQPELKSETLEQTPKDGGKTPKEEQVSKRTSMQTRYKGKFTPETGTKSKKDRETFVDEKPVNTFQEAFLKTLQMDKKRGMSDDSEAVVGKGKKGKKTVKRKLDEQDNATVTSTGTQEAKSESSEKAVLPESVSNIQAQEANSQVSIMGNFEGMEVVVDQNLKIGTKVDDAMFQNVSHQMASSSADFGMVSKSLTQSPLVEDTKSSVSLDMQKLDESSRMSMSTPSPSSDVAVPVKKREMPRIIENVTLTEPMQILKSKLMDKLPQKGVKHKLDSDGSKKSEQKGSPKAKIMKIESIASNSKMKTGPKVTSPHLSIAKKLQVLKAEESESMVGTETQNEQLNIQTSQASTAASVSEKFIPQTSQSLADMELDINSMPFVLSDDLTPESIEQMPVVISSIIPASSTMAATLSFTPTTQIVSPTHTQFKITSESSGETSPTKKKSGTPAILKNKNKAKPTITSIKTLVPPLTGGVKGIKFQNTPAGKPPLLTQKATSGKYVVVQTAGGQQLRYSVQGKPGTPQKIAIPTGKSAANAQVVQQSGKVVILASAQTGPTKMLPLNISKSLSGKVQRIMTSKAQVFCPISPQGIITSKTIIAPKSDVVSPTTSKLPPGHKIINTQGIITSKAVLTPIPGSIAKSALLGTLPQGILTKGGVYTPISAAALGGKTIIGSKALVTKGATILSPQTLGTSKAILTPISQTVGGKPILSSQGIMSTKGTVLTPITGQQVKAIAAKSPTKGGKVQYQPVQQKVQLPALQKSQKTPISAAQGRSGQMKASTNTLVLQSSSPGAKTVQQGKKLIKQTLVQGAAIQNIAQGSPQQTIGIMPQVQQKGKAAATSGVPKVIIPRGSSRQLKTQQKIVVQKTQKPTISGVQTIHSKQPVSVPPTNVPISKAVHQKHMPGTSTTSKSSGKGHASSKTAQQQKNLLNVAMNSVTGANATANPSTSLSLPPLEPIESEKKKVESVLMESVQKEQPKTEKFNVEKGNETEKLEEPKVQAQPQIMALPTESSDGTQTYVLVTIDEQGQIQPLDNNTLMSLEGTTQNPDGTRTLYIDPSSLGEAGTLDNIVLQFDNGVLPNIQTSGAESTQTIISESFPTSEVIQTSNQDILAAALANTDFQQEINLPENPAGSVMSTGLTQTSLINQTILQSTIIPPTEPISSPSVLETSLTLNQPIMTPLEVPSNLPIQSETTPTSTVSTIASSLELPITITNPSISYISTGEAQIQMPGNSMPDIGEIMENSNAGEIARADIPASTQYLVIPNLAENIAVEAQSVQTGAISMPNVSYSVSIPNNLVLESPQVQTTPSMPIIDDGYSESVQFTTSMEPSMASEQTFADVPVSEMLVSKAPVSAENVQSQDITVTSGMIISHDIPVSSQESIASSNETAILRKEQESATPMPEVYSSQEVPITSEELILQQPIIKEDSTSDRQDGNVKDNGNVVGTQVEEQRSEPMTSSMPIIDETSMVTSETNVKISSVERMNFEVTDSGGMETDIDQESKTTDKFKQLSFSEQSSSKLLSPVAKEQPATSEEVESIREASQVLPAESLNRLDEQSMNIEEAADSKVYPASTIKHSEDCQRDEPSSQGEGDLVQRNLELHFDETSAETSHEIPSQSYEQFGISMTSDSADLPSQSATKSENSREPSQSITYEPMETDEEAVVPEPPTQSFEHSKINEASQSYEATAEANTNAPTQSFNELMQSQDERSTVDETIDDQTFPTQSYEVGKTENISENLETDAEISQEGNIPSQSNDIGADGIGTSSVSTNNSGLNEDETASSSYVPETPENQERDQDQESAISTSSYEIPPCEELNIASSSVIPDTSVRAEHTSIHDNGVPEIPTSSYNLNPDITSTHVDSVPTSSYEDQVIVEQNVSTSYEVSISMPGLEETCSQNFVTESTDHRNEPSSFYTHHQEVTASYYESVDQETNSRLEEDPQEEVTPSYYEGNPQEASQSYFAPEEATQSYSSHNVSPSYYDPRPESEASQSYYSTDEMKKAEQSSSQNIEASQSFYQEQSDELKLRQGEATPTYTERYPVDYTLENSPIERHDLVESSVPATRPTKR